MTYVFRWKCLSAPAELGIVIEAPNDKVAGELAAHLLHDFARGRHREETWSAQLPMIQREVPS